MDNKGNTFYNVILSLQLFYKMRLFPEAIYFPKKALFTRGGVDSLRYISLTVLINDNRLISKTLPCTKGELSTLVEQLMCNSKNVYNPLCSQ